MVRNVFEASGFDERHLSGLQSSFGGRLSRFGELLSALATVTTVDKSELKAVFEKALPMMLKATVGT